MESARRGRPGDTRGRILALLCEANRTIGDLAGALGINRNSVREQVRRLEEDGLVGYEVVRRGVGKPAHEYHLTDQGEAGLSRAYVPILRGLIAALEERAPEAEVEELMRGVGRALAARSPRPEGGSRAEAALGLLASLGGAGRLAEEEGRPVIIGRCCPISAVASAHPVACKAVEALLGEYAGVPVKERCSRGGRPACRFELARPG